MRIIGYVIDDHDVIETFFGEDAPTRPLANVGRDHGRKVLDQKVPLDSDIGDMIVINDVEYYAAFRIWKFWDDAEPVLELILHARHLESVQS